MKFEFSRMIYVVTRKFNLSRLPLASLPILVTITQMVTNVP